MTHQPRGSRPGSPNAPTCAAKAAGARAPGGGPFRWSHGQEERSLAAPAGCARGACPGLAPRCAEFVARLCSQVRRRSSPKSLATRAAPSTRVAIQVRTTESAGRARSIPPAAGKQPRTAGPPGPAVQCRPAAATSPASAALPRGPRSSPPAAPAQPPHPAARPRPQTRPAAPTAPQRGRACAARAGGRVPGGWGSV